MKKYISLVLVLFTLVFGACVKAQDGKTKISVNEFSATINSNPEVVVLDVRTPEEFSKGHLQTATNFNWKGNLFETQIANLDKSQPVLVYCLSGARSAKAAAEMRAGGFKAVYELDGGIMKWRNANLPITAETPIDPGMSVADFNHILESDKLVLVDFYAEWCAPCKKMEPYLKEISEEMGNTVNVVRINADDNPVLCKALGVDGLPVLQVYKEKALIWQHTGFIDKEAVVKQLQ